MRRTGWRLAPARCGICGRIIGRMRSGQFRRHVRELGGDGEICPGSWKFPEEMLRADLQEGTEFPAYVDAQGREHAEY